MKLFNRKRRDNHGRSNEPPAAASPSPVAAAAAAAVDPSAAPISPSCSPESRTSAAAAAPPAAQPLPPPPDAAGPAPVARKEVDFMLSEEEFQVQLAIAISNSEFPEDPHGDQIRAAKLLSLGKKPLDQLREDEGAAGSLSRRYWEYNVLDYEEKVVDGFYDIFGPPKDFSNQGKMPALVDLQNGNLGFEAIAVNRETDTALVELEQIAQCIVLGCPVMQLELLVQRLAELVSEHMGGPVKDASVMLARWSEKSIELRTSLQTSLLPLGGITIGLSRHRALLFKVLADKISLPCKLVKGSDYIGIDDGALNMVKLDKEREFLVDLMADPGILIPADVLSAKEASLNYSDPRTAQSLPSMTSIKGDELARTKQSVQSAAENGLVCFDGNGCLDRRPNLEAVQTEILIPPFVIQGEVSSTNTGSSSSSNVAKPFLHGQPNNLPPLSDATSKLKGVLVSTSEFINLASEKPMRQSLQDTEDSRDLFADLNPFQVVGIQRNAVIPQTADNSKLEYQRNREHIALGHGRNQRPLVWKQRPACNEFPNAKPYNILDVSVQRKDKLKDNNVSLQQPLVSGVKTYSSGLGIAGTSNSTYIVADSSHSKVEGSSTTSSISGEKSSTSAAQIDCSSKKEPMHGRESIRPIMKNSEIRLDENHVGRKFSHDRIMSAQSVLKIPGTSTSTSEAKPRLDPMLDDVAECEIPWEDLVIGERIGLGSYGEVYRAEWNGTEVAVKKFLDQDFYGDALDEFRSEVRIMRRLRHPNIVLFMGAVTRPPNLSIVSEFLPRGSLYKIFHRPNCPIDEKRRIKMALDVAKGMNCLHTSIPTIVHRDLKSLNLLVDNNWTVKVCDFGLSRLKHNTFLSSKSTAGTPEWMAPEVLRNEPSNEKCDVYSFGVILWELSTLRMPWSGMNPMQVVGAVGFQERRLEIPKEVDPMVARIIWECWQTDPCLRPSFLQLTSALKSLQRLTVTAAPSHQDSQGPVAPLTDLG